MVQNLAALLGGRGGIADDVDDRHVFAERTTDAAESAQLAGSEGGHEGACALVPSVAISGIGSDELVGRADPCQAFGLDQVKKGKLKVYGWVRLSRAVRYQRRVGGRSIPPGTPKTVSIPISLRRWKRYWPTRISDIVSCWECDQRAGELGGGWLSRVIKDGK